MSTDKKKKVVVSTGNRSDAKAARPPRPPEKKPVELLFNKGNYMWMAGGAALIFIGLFLMSGGSMPNPDEWIPEQIYSFRRTVLAPMVILAGLSVVIYAIFKK